ncbi:histidine phosphatase family protein [Pseudobacteriovorax antillogorgiicola]|uniref:2,3-bisphosphoglycerate-dependent phosphoglycerate mutase n=1 Tax=Pseudobacteriovorax antillogorgiicola TaxID=1513793 RepID=A0A1Y6BBP9_9BACT|nr:histidine phosphatase family protein [Pseudobacteriovorax antillogorgiicola]TCS58760.1 2,3-bisphosphoglycerate-dependent phosphoglycerate mutase [Pseudobacteriovorax antillogorgiicola]SME95009.1 2,3-bisphosphoglycerate-dependent phosphoglycerate mutase [Pseudobacteriovorax antillogorgiicola]
MSLTIYLLRHSQSNPRSNLPSEEWPLTEKGQQQSRRLVSVLNSLGIDKVFSSPYKRCIDTIKPFIESIGRPFTIEQDLHECHVTHQFLPDPNDFWDIFERSWNDFTFSYPDGESCRKGQDRIIRLIDRLKSEESGTLLLSSHGNLISLLLNSLDSGFGFQESRQLKNPDLIKITVSDAISWDKTFDSAKLLGEIFTDQDQTPITIEASGHAETRLQ